MFTRSAISLALAVTGVLVIVETVNAEFVGSRKDSADFTYKYEMDVMPSTLDLDNNTVMDMDANGPGYSLADGVLTITASGSTYMGCESAGKIWQASMGSGDYTIEFTNKVLESTGNKGAFLLMAANGASGTASFTVSDTEISWLGTFGGGVTFTGDNTDAFHTYRVVKQTVADQMGFYLWRDGALIVDNAGPNIAYQTMYFGGGSGDIVGVSQMEYFRMTQGAYAPIPEPSSIALLVSAMIGLVAYAWRKRG